MPTHKIKLTATDRGFLLGVFKDQTGHLCSIQESSLATDDCLWLGAIEGTHHQGHCLARMHLTRAHAEALIPLLQNFVDTGKLPHKPRKRAGRKP